jgi:hypothetical protein
MRCSKCGCRNYRHNPSPDEIITEAIELIKAEYLSPDELKQFIREIGKPGLIGAPYRRYIRMVHRDYRPRPRGLHGPLLPVVRDISEYREIFNSIEPIAYNVWWFNYIKGMTEVEMAQAIINEGYWDDADPHTLLSPAEGVALITPELHEILTSSLYQPGSDSASDAQQSTILGIAVAQAVRIIQFREPEIDWWDPPRI